MSGSNCGFLTRIQVSQGTGKVVKKPQLEPDMEQVVPDWEKSTSRLYIVTLFI